MLRTVSTLTLGLLVLSGCPGDDSGTTAGSAGTSTGASTTNEPATESSQPQTTSGESADTTAGGPGTTTDTPGTTTDTPGTTTDTPGTTTDEPGTSSGGMLDACAECVEGQCGDELAACMADPACSCFQDCAAMNPGIAGALACAGECDIPVLDLMNPATIAGALATCTQDNCPKCLM